MRLNLVLQLTVDVRDEQAVRHAARQSLVPMTEQAGDDEFADVATSTSTTPAALSVIFGSGQVFDALQAVVQGVAGLELTGLFVHPSTVTATPPSRPR